MLWVSLSFRAAPWQEVWLPPLGLRWLSVTFIAIALWLLVDGLVARLRARPTLPPPIAAYAVTRQPIMVAIVLWAGAHMLVRGDAATVLLFGGFAVLGIAGALSQARLRGRDVARSPGGPHQWSCPSQPRGYRLVAGNRQPDPFARYALAASTNIRTQALALKN
jgi:uncharacterized membrane protein